MAGKTVKISQHSENVFGSSRPKYGTITYTLVASLGYFGIIIAEPIVWSLMVVPLIIRWSLENRSAK